MLCRLLVLLGGASGGSVGVGVVLDRDVRLDRALGDGSGWGGMGGIGRKPGVEGVVGVVVTG